MVKGVAMESSTSLAVALGELRGVERLEVRIGPVGLEDPVEGLDQVGVAALGCPDVPLPSGDLRREREVGRSDVDGREPGGPVEAPRLGMEPGAGRVVGDLHLGTDVGERLKRAQLGAAGVGGGDDPQRLAGLGVPAKRRQKVAHPRPADEGEHEIDAVGRFDLRHDLPTDRRLVACVRHQHRVAERRERASDRHRLAGGSQRLDGDEALQARRQPRPGASFDAIAVDEQVQHPGGDRDRGVVAVCRRLGGDHITGPVSDDLGDPVGKLGRFDLSELGPQPPGVETTDLIGERLAEDRVVQTCL